MLIEKKVKKILSMDSIKTIQKLSQANILTKPITIPHSSILKDTKHLKITVSQFNTVEELDNLLRQAVFMRTTEIKDVFEGEIVEVKEDGLVLRGRKGTLFVKTKPKGEVKDVIYIENEISEIIGRVERENDLECKRVCSLPKEVHRKKERFLEVSLNELDESFGEINFKVKNEVNQLVKGKEIIKGNVLILEAHRLKEEFIEFIKFKCENELCPVIFLEGENKLTGYKINQSEESEEKKVKKEKEEKIIF
ncbi:helicase 1 like protein [Tubulinosema ratisbonensis]|uniref:Helicase 1 like protein n=1 Tax=Tubulinosema ratisbonensis TaxID=291195 RepID=A0A437AK83_9MICR|nr:helicase 1 like protein [Tubulinosema ratisbonensis]